MELNKIYNENCLITFDRLKDKSVDIVFTDPPYNVGKDYGYFKDNLLPAEYKKLMQKVVYESVRIAKKGIIFYVGGKLTGLFMDLIPDAHLIIVHKRAVGIMQGNYFLQYHSLLSTVNPVKKIKDLWDDIRLPGEGYYFREERFNHPGLTSELLVLKVIDSFTEENDIIFDCFMGTCTTAISAIKTRRQFIGSEINKRYIEIGTRRIKNHLAQQKLF